LKVYVLLLTICSHAFGGGVTLITHGYNGNVTDWVIPMCNRIPQYPTFPGTNYSIYQISITKTGSVYYATSALLGGTNPVASDSGEIIIALDWSTVANGSPATTVIATQAVNAVLSPTIIPALAGRPLAEFPLHLAGHSRGASVVTEMARILGAQGIWVDHVTTFDPYPVSFFGDPSIKNYANVFFADDYWQNTDFPQGQVVSGAYSRYLTNVAGGYPSGSAHSDTHLWYHGTVDLNTPATDTQATVSAAERANWWKSGEARGTNTGLFFSLIGKGDRLSTNEPAGPGTGRVRDGLNKMWDFGAGIGANRSTLPSNNGTWPNPIRLEIIGTNQFASGDPVPARLYYQYGSNALRSATVTLSLDADTNPYNGNERELGSALLPGTGTNLVANTNLSFAINPALILPGAYSLVATIGDSTHSRFLYASQKIIVTSGEQPPALTSVRTESGQFRFTIAGQAGQSVVIQSSTNLAHWISLQTNLLSTGSADFSEPIIAPNRFYRALLLR
jgi:hypothetical protein